MPQILRWETGLHSGNCKPLRGDSAPCPSGPRYLDPREEPQGSVLVGSPTPEEIPEETAQILSLSGQPLERSGFPVPEEKFQCPRQSGPRALQVTLKSHKEASDSISGTPILPMSPEAGSSSQDRNLGPCDKREPSNPYYREKDRLLSPQGVFQSHRIEKDLTPMRVCVWRLGLRALRTLGRQSMRRTIS